MAAVSRPLGISVARVGGQLGVVTPHAWIGYVLTALVALLALLAHLVRPSWPYLAGAVAAVTLAVPEAVADWTNGSVGVIGGVLSGWSHSPGRRSRQRAVEPPANSRVQLIALGVSSRAATSTPPISVTDSP